jgi:hypothetical protein
MRHYPLAWKKAFSIAGRLRWAAVDPLAGFPDAALAAGLGQKPAGFAAGAGSAALGESREA